MAPIGADEPSSGRFDTKLAETLLNDLEAAVSSSTDSEAIVKHHVCAFVQARRYPTLALAAHVAGAMRRHRATVIPFLRGYIRMKQSLNERLIARAQKDISIGPGDGVLIYGYSEPVLATLCAYFRAQDRESRSKIRVYVAEATPRRLRRDGAKAAQRLAETKVNVSILSDASTGNQMSWPKDAAVNRPHLPEIRHVFMGCKTILARPTPVKFNCTIGARPIAVYGTFDPAAKDHVKVYMVGEAYKIWPSLDSDSEFLRDIRLSESTDDWFGQIYGDREVAELKRSEIRIENFVADLVPATMVDYLLTEEGLLEGREKLTRDALVDVCRSAWRELYDFGFWDPNVRAEGLSDFEKWERDYRKVFNSPLPQVDIGGTMITDYEINNLVSETLEKEPQIGRSDLSRLISTAVALHDKAKSEGSTESRALADKAWKGASSIFRQYGRDLNSAIADGLLEPTELNRRQAAIYGICEMDVNKYRSLDTLEAAAEKEVDELHSVWRALRRELDRTAIEKAR